MTGMHPDQQEMHQEVLLRREIDQILRFVPTPEAPGHNMVPLDITVENPLPGTGDYLGINPM